MFLPQPHECRGSSLHVPTCLATTSSECAPPFFTGRTPCKLYGLHSKFRARRLRRFLNCIAPSGAAEAQGSVPSVSSGSSSSTSGSQTDSQTWTHSHSKDHRRSKRRPKKQAKRLALPRPWPQPRIWAAERNSPFPGSIPLGHSAPPGLELLQVSALDLFSLCSATAYMWYISAISDWLLPVHGSHQSVFIRPCLRMDPTKVCSSVHVYVHVGAFKAASSVHFYGL